MMQRVEAKGLGVALAAHAALLGLLAYGFDDPDPKPKILPISVELVTEDVGLESTAPTPSAQEPAPLLAPEEGPPAPALAEPVPAPLPVPRVEPAPAPRVTPTPPPPRPVPTPKAVPRPQPRPVPAQARPAPPKPAPPRPAPAQAKAAPTQAAKPSAPAGQPKGSATRPTGRLNGVLASLGTSNSQSKAASPPAKRGDAKVEASLVAEVRRKVKPHWQRNVPTGADAEQLKTELVITLARSGAITGIRVTGTTGTTASNRPQVALHQERARKAVTLAAPFGLPAEFYENWKELTITLDMRLAQ
ncbi:MAG TPA: cell envelope biogenesis protein TolA [Allosphingosinicella sp.]|jgi:outer membrane biosynthesis protein TonB